MLLLGDGDGDGDGVDDGVSRQDGAGDAIARFMTCIPGCLEYFLPSLFALLLSIG